MFTVVFKKILLSLSVLSLALGVLMLPVPTLAADDLEVSASTPTAYLERSQIIGTGNQIKVYRLPTTNSNGVVDYYDVTINLNPATIGKPKSTAKVTTSPAPEWYTNEFIPGTYSEGIGSHEVNCTVTTAILNGGRMEVALACKEKSGSGTFSGGALSGLISGHPFELDLLAAGIDKIPGYSNYSWGKVGYTWGNYNWWGCLSTGDIMSARQVGNTLVLSGYGDGNEQKCGVSLLKQE